MVSPLFSQLFGWMMVTPSFVRLFSVLYLSAPHYAWPSRAPCWLPLALTTGSSGTQPCLSCWSVKFQIEKAVSDNAHQFLLAIVILKQKGKDTTFFLFIICTAVCCRDFTSLRCSLDKMSNLTQKPALASYALSLHVYQLKSLFIYRSILFCLSVSIFFSLIL